MSPRNFCEPPRRRRPAPMVLAVGLAFIAAGCQDSRVPTEPAPASAAATMSLAQVSQEETPDQLAVARVVAGFGGYFFDESGAPTVYLTDPSRRPDAEQALATFLSSHGFTPSDLRVRQGDYDYIQLDAWHDRAWPKALSVTGAVFSDLDEGANRLRFGGLNAEAIASVTAAVAGAGVPGAAFVVEQADPIEQVATLRDRVRPVQGGYQINFFPSPISPVSLVCTLGFNAVKNGVNSFITNSHCTNVQGGTETPTDYYQPIRGTTPNPNNFIGVEVDDPHYSFTDCLDVIPGFRCRYSDAARAAYDAAVPFELGRIGRTLARDRDVGTLEIDPIDPSFTITGQRKRSIIGEQANKVGRTTGWTYGPVIQTCINTIVSGTNIIQRCQDRVQAGVAGGDSGSPVFRRSGNSGNVRLMGILWGSSTRDGKRTFVFSPMHGVHRDLGDFATH